MSWRALRTAAGPVAVASLAVILAVAMAMRFVHAAQQLPGLEPLDAGNPITYFIADGSRAPGYRSSDRQLALWALEAWERNSAKSFRFAPADSESSAVVRVYWAGAGDGQYGETHPLVVGGRPGAAVFIAPDAGALSPEIAQRIQSDDLLRDAIVYLTCLHELGHALGLPHTRDFRDIMYSFAYGGDIPAYFDRYRVQLHSRADIAAASGLSDGDVSHVRALYQHP
jgi:hypothetical protein